MAKKVTRIIAKVLGGLFLTVYVLVALLNYSLVQSFAGAYASSYFQQKWGGTVRIGALHAHPFSHIIVDDLLLVDPAGDTLYCGDLLKVRFRRFPFRDGGLDVERVFLKNARYHFASFYYPDSTYGINLDYIIHSFGSVDEADTLPAEPFPVRVGELVLDNVDYIQDLPEDHGYVWPEHGVSIPHMRYWDVTGRFRDVVVINDSVTCRIVTLQTHEESGLNVRHLEADVVVSPNIIKATNMDLQTDNSHLMLDAELRYHNWEMEDYMNDVQHDVTIKPGSYGDVCEAGYWAPTLWGAQCRCNLQLHFTGTISDMRAEDLVVTFGDDSYLFLDAHMTGLPDIEHTALDADLYRVHLTYRDIMAVRHPEWVRMHVTDLLRQMNVIDLSGVVDGGLDDLVADIRVNTAIGDAALRVASQYDSLQRDYAFFGNVDSRTLGIRSVVPNEWVSRTGLHLSFQGHGRDLATMNATLEGSLHNTNIRDHEVEHVAFNASMQDGTIAAAVDVTDTLMDFDLKASANLKEQKYGVNLTAKHLDFTGLGIHHGEQPLTLSTRLDAEVEGRDLDHLRGSLRTVNTTCRLGDQVLHMDGINLTLDEVHDRKRIDLTTDWFNLRLRGYLQYADLLPIVSDFCNQYVPTYFNPFRQDEPRTDSTVRTDDFTLYLTWNDERHTLGQFMPGLSVAQGTTLHLAYNGGEDVRIVLRSDSLAWGAVRLSDVGFNTIPRGENYQLLLNAGRVDMGGVRQLDNFYLTAGLGSRISTLALRWDDDEQSVLNQGDLEFFLSSSEQDNRLMVSKTNFYIDGSRWSLVCPQGVCYNAERLLVEDLKLYGLGQSLSCKCEVSHADADYFLATFDDFSLGRVAGLLLANAPVQISGILDGTVTAKGLNQTPYIDANLSIDDFVCNGQHAGRVDIKSKYNTESAQLLVDLTTHHLVDGEIRCPISLEGSMTLKGASPQLDFDVGLKNVSLQTLGPVIADISSNIDGHIDGSLQVRGTLSAPQVGGEARIRDGVLLLNATGVNYHFSDSFSIADNVLTLDSFRINDDLSNTALVNGTVALREGSLDLNLGLHADKLQVLDKKPSGDNFYGRLLASVDGTVAGPVQHLSIRANATALSGSDVYVPINNRRQIGEQDFITFLDADSHVEEVRHEAAASQMDMLVNVTVTSGVKVHLPMDFSEVMANVTASGRGDVRLVMEEGNPMVVLGNYEFASGNLSLSLMNLLTKNFVIERGSSINFPGSVDDARFDISAAYSQRVNLATLSSSLTGESDSYVQVQNIISLKGTLGDPEIKFDIKLPNADQSLTDNVFTYIDRTNERDMLNQSVSLLLLGRFAVSDMDDGSQDDDETGINMLASSVGSMLASMVRVVDVNLKYQSDASSGEKKFDVGISKQWEKFYFESTFGYKLNNGMSDDNANTFNNIVGDVEVGYRFTPYFQLFGFNRSNTSYYTRTEMPTKQGFGIKWTRDFDNVGELFGIPRK